MVVLLDLDDEEGPEDARPSDTPDVKTYCQRPAEPEAAEAVEVEEDKEEAQTTDSGFSRALACYPIAVELAACLDLNALHELSRTCRQIRANLLQFRSQLIAHTLRCENEQDNSNLGSRLGNGLREAVATWSTFGTNGVQTGRITSGRIGLCARDMVGECRRCSRIVCRNCVVKQPSTDHLADRHRRLCRTCLKVPAEKHTSFIVEHMDEEPQTSPDVFTYQAFARDPCTCAEHVWICQDCGHSLRTDDVTYVRGWTWRKRYSTHLGGLGTGTEELAHDAMEAEKARLEGRSRSATGYFMQEIEGIGGVMKKKVKKRERVGRVVKEYEDEREYGNYLAREKDGVNRSWCWWCRRIILSKADLEVEKHDHPLERIDSSGSSAESLH